MAEGGERFLCIASHERGHDFLRQCALMGVKATLLTAEKLRDAPWPHESLEDVATLPPGLTGEQVLNTVSWMARGRHFDRVIALDEVDQAVAAQIREHMRVPGMGITTAAYYHDKLAMRISARDSGFSAPEIVVRMKKHHHAGLIVCSPQANPVKDLLEGYSAEFARRFLASMAPREQLPA